MFRGFPYTAYDVAGHFTSLGSSGFRANVAVRTPILALLERHLGFRWVSMLPGSPVLKVEWVTLAVLVLVAYRVAKGYLVWHQRPKINFFVFLYIGGLAFKMTVC
jgi:hypothetical protein